MRTAWGPRLLLTAALLAGCSNDAITYAHSAYQGSRCNAVFTRYLSDRPDTAVCTWYCQVISCTKDRCDKVRDMSQAECDTKNDRMGPR